MNQTKLNNSYIIGKEIALNNLLKTKRSFFDVFFGTILADYKKTNPKNSGNIFNDLNTTQKNVKVNLLVELINLF